MQKNQTFPRLSLGLNVLSMRPPPLIQSLIHLLMLNQGEQLWRQKGPFRYEYAHLKRIG